LEFFEDSADVGKNVFRRTRWESGQLALKMSKQEEVAGCTIWRLSQMSDPVGFGSGNSLSRPFGVVTWCIIQMHIDDSKRPSALAAEEVLLDIRKNRCEKEICGIRHAGRQCKKTVDSGRGPNSGHPVFFILSSP
jgi:hypothetical protein